MPVWLHNNQNQKIKKKQAKTARCFFLNLAGNRAIAWPMASLVTESGEDNITLTTDVVKSLVCVVMGAAGNFVQGDLELLFICAGKHLKSRCRFIIVPYLKGIPQEV